ncbi:MAG: imidazole glycerol phosphate synthase subunit HisH [Planctomycetaceae bacterium]
MIAIVDYGMGNLRSVQKAFEKLGHAAEVVQSPKDVARADKLVLPGVGAFRDAIRELNRLDLSQSVVDHIQSDKPFLGICLGLQLLFDVSFEDGEWPGLSVIPGQVTRFEIAPELKVPHMGWNELIVPRPNPLLAGIPEPISVYFVHSYHVVPQDDSVAAAYTDYGGPFVSMVARNNLFATQFHPEKSQQVGLKLLANFAEM